MAKITYLLGAGASYGLRDSTYPEKVIYIKKTNSTRIISYNFTIPNIIEGLPIVNELPGRMKYIESIIREKISNNPDDDRLKLADIIEWVEKETRRHATIDTLAKKLYITGQVQKYNELKRAISAYFMLEQLTGHVDRRYDSFFASILGEEATSLPNNISILSWNYDCQLELAYKEYLRIPSLSKLQEILSVRNKLFNTQSSYDNKFAVIKLNGSALLYDKFSKECIDTHFNNDVEHIKYISSLMLNHSPDIINALSFAWEKYSPDFISKLECTIKDSESLVIIGYSFPYFNREIDKMIFSSMTNLKKIYIQDANPDRIEQSITNLLTPIQRNINKVEIHKLYDTTQFYLPPEL